MRGGQSRRGGSNVVRHGEHREGVLRGAHKSHSMEGADTGLSGTELCLTFKFVPLF